MGAWAHSGSPFHTMYLPSIATCSFTHKHADIVLTPVQLEALLDELSSLQILVLKNCGRLLKACVSWFYMCIEYIHVQVDTACVCYCIAMYRTMVLQWLML